MRSISVLLLYVISLGCTGIVKKPEVFHLKKIAVLNIKANQGLYNISESLSGGFFSFSYSKNADNEKMISLSIPQPGGYRLADYGLYAFEEELAKIKGWQMVPAIKIVNSPGYQKLSRKIFRSPDRVTASEAISKWFSPQGMVPVSDPGSVLSNSEAISALKDFMEASELDGVAFVNMDLAYAPDHTSTGSKELQGAYASVGSSIKIVAKSGNIVVSTPEVSQGAGDRQFSDRSSPLLGLQLIYGDEVESMYKAAIQKSAVALREKINKEL